MEASTGYTELNLPIEQYSHGIRQDDS